MEDLKSQKITLDEAKQKVKTLDVNAVNALLWDNIVKYKNKEACELLLLSPNIEINKTNDTEMTIFHAAVMYTPKEIFESILLKNPNVNIKTKVQNTLCHVINNNRNGKANETIKLLIKHPTIDINQSHSDYDKRNAIEIALYKEDNDVVEELKTSDRKKRLKLKKGAQ